MPDSSQSPHQAQRNGNCPSCRRQTTFRYLGIQHWPEKLVRLKGLPADQILWQCMQCKTTLLDPSIK